MESPIEILDYDVILLISSYFNFAERMRLEAVSHNWKKISQLSWRQVNTLDFSHSTWGILPISKTTFCDCVRDFDHIESDRLVDPTVLTEPSVRRICPGPDRCSQFKIFCPKILEKVLSLCADTVTHYDFSIDYEVQNRHDVFIKLSERAISEFFKSCKNLKWLRIIQEDWIEFPIMSLINLRLEKLEELHIDLYCGDEEEIICFQEIFKNSPRLHTIELSEVQIDPEQLEMIANKDGLKSLVLKTLYPNDAMRVIKCLSEFKNLERCEISDLDDMTDIGLKVLTDNCRKLKSILLKRSEITNKGLLYLKSLPNLESLKLWLPRQITDDNLHLFPNLKNLECLFAPSIKDAGLIKLLKSSQSLEKLMLIQTGITIGTLEAANDAVKSRTNGRSLEIRVNKYFPIHLLKNVSPLLKIVIQK